MLSIGAIASGQGEYYLNLAREDYYLEGGEPPGKWVGSGARALGLRGTIGKDELRNTLQGFSADGQRALIKNAGDERHQPGWDLTFSAPKSVSVLWSQASEHARRQIQDAHAASVKAAFAYLEESAAYTRRGHAGRSREPAGLVVATFEHGTSRAIDPQLHTHCLVMNVGSRADGTTGTVLSKPLYEHKMAAGALYRAELSSQLERRLGIVCERTKNWFEVKGMPGPLLQAFSKRRAAIEERLLANGLETASAAAFAALATRQPKDLVAPRSELFAHWQETGREYGFDRSLARSITGTSAERNPERELKEAFREALDTITASYSHFSEREFIRHAAEAAQGRGLSAATITNAARHELENSADVVRLGMVNGERRYTTQEMMQLERELLETAEGMRDDASHAIRASRLKKVIAGKPTLTAEQRAALIHATQARGRVQVISGMAGTGKTFMLAACREAWEKEGFMVMGAALSGKAARELETGSGIQGDTLAKRLWDLQHASLGDRIKHDLKQIAREAVGKTTRPFERFQVGQRTIVVLDEAGMVGTRQLEQLVKAVERGGGKLVLVGDAKQLQPIEAGGPFQALARVLGKAELTQITRQAAEWARQSVHELAAGESAAALKRYAEHGLLSVSKNREQAIHALVADWRKEGLRRPEDNLVFVGTNLEAVKINRLCQAARLERDGETRNSKLRAGTDTIHVGDRVLCTKKNRFYGLENGDMATAIRIDRNRQAITLKLDRGQVVTISVKDYGDLRLGYAVTTHKGQGATVQRAYVLLGGSMQDREISYVQASRARLETRLYADELEAGEDLRGLTKQMSQSRAKGLAHDVADRSPEANLRPEISH